MKTRRKVLLAILVAPVAALVLARVVAGDPTPVARHPFFEGARTPLNIAHRGASIERAEHTWDAYDLALQHGADVLELDVRMTKDGTLVVAHDRDLMRVAGVPAKVAESTLAELRAAAGDRAPLPLADVFARYPGRINLEIKEDRPLVAEALADLLRSTGRERNVIVASFHKGVLEHFRERAGPHVATAAHGREGLWFYASYLLGLSRAPTFVALQIPRRLGGRLDLGTKAFVAFAHRHGLAVHYWTIDDEAEMRELLDAGADGVMTNHPERLERVIRARRS